MRIARECTISLENWLKMPKNRHYSQETSPIPSEKAANMAEKRPNISLQNQLHGTAGNHITLLLAKPKSQDKAFVRDMQSNTRAKYAAWARESPSTYFTTSIVIIEPFSGQPPAGQPISAMSGTTIPITKVPTRSSFSGILNFKVVVLASATSIFIGAKIR